MINHDNFVLGVNVRMNKMNTSFSRSINRRRQISMLEFSLYLPFKYLIKTERNMLLISVRGILHSGINTFHDLL